MDPNALLAEIRAIANRPRPTSMYGASELLSRLSTRIDELDTWITKGGFLPEAWTNAGVVKAMAQQVEPLNEIEVLERELGKEEPMRDRAR